MNSRGVAARDDEALAVLGRARPGGRQVTDVGDPGPTPGDRVEGLRLARSKALQDLQQACDRRHRARIEQRLADVDRELRALEGVVPSEENR